MIQTKAPTTLNTGAGRTSTAAQFADMSTEPIQATDPEQREIDAVIDNDLEFWKEQKNGRPGEVVEAMVRVTP